MRTIVAFDTSRYLRFEHTWLQHGQRHTSLSKVFRNDDPPKLKTIIMLEFLEAIEQYREQINSQHQYD